MAKSRSTDVSKSSSAKTMKVAAIVTTRGPGDVNIRDIDVKKISHNINIFMGQMEGVLAKTPENLGGFSFSECEIQAGITAEGLSGAIKFVFRRSGAGK